MTLLLLILNNEWINFLNNDHILNYFLYALQKQDWMGYSYEIYIF